MVSVLCAALVLRASETENGSAQQKSVVIVLRCSDSSGMGSVPDTAAVRAAFASSLAQRGFGVTDYNVVVSSLNEFLKGDDANKKSAAIAVKNALQSKTQASQTLLDSASALRLADMLGVDYILDAVVVDNAPETMRFAGKGISTENTRYVQTAFFTLYESGMGTARTGGSVESSRTLRASADSSVSSASVYKTLAFENAEKVASKLFEAKKAGAMAGKTVDHRYEVNIDMVLKSLKLPMFVLEDGKIGLREIPVDAEVESVNALIDGVAATLNNKITLTKGIHFIEIRQEGIEPLQMPINVTHSGQKITLQLQLTEAERNRAKTDAAFAREQAAAIRELESRVKISEEQSSAAAAVAEAAARANVLRASGYAEYMKKSGLDVKIDAKSLGDNTTNIVH